MFAGTDAPARLPVVVQAFRRRQGFGGLAVALAEAVRPVVFFVGRPSRRPPYFWTFRKSKAMRSRPGPVRDQPTRVLSEKRWSRLTLPRPSGRPFAATRSA